MAPPFGNGMDIPLTTVCPTFMKSIPGCIGKLGALFVQFNQIFIDADCTGPEGWTQRGSNWYKTMSNLTYNFDEANTYCRSYGAQLPIFKTKAELNNLVASISMKQ